MSNFSSIENMNLTKGIAGGLGVLDFAQASRATRTNGKKKNLRSSLKILKDMLKEIYSNNPLSKQRKIFVSPAKEKGHSLAFSGQLILLSSGLGLIFKPLEKVMNVARNIGAIISNTITMYHPDSQKKLCGTLFNVYAVLDSVQKFLPENIASSINNINMGLYNIAVYFYGDLSHQRTQNTFHHYQS